MKKVLATVAAIGCLAAAGTALGGIPAGTGVNGSLHDMTVVVPGTADVMGRVCVYCHTPHHAVVMNGGANLPLWNHNITNDDQFTAYTWATPNNSNDGQFDIVDPLAGPSRLCMSCHDGAIAIDQHGEAFDQAGGTTIGNMGKTWDGQGRANLTKDLSTTHPIGFNYNEIAAFRNSKSANRTDVSGASEIVPASFGYAWDIDESTTAGTYNAISRYNDGAHKTIADNLYGGEIMTCATCHEVHNKENATQEPYKVASASYNGVGYDDGITVGSKQTAPNYFLYAKQDKSLICLSCHIK